MTSSLRIAMVSSARSIHTIRWVEWLKGRGHEVALFSLVENSGATHFGPEPPLDRRYLFTLGSTVRRTTARLRRMLDDFAPQVVHGFNLVNHGNYAVRAGRHPVVITALGSDVLLAPDESWLLSRIVRKTALGADRVIAPPVLVENLQKWGVNEKRLLPLIFGVDCNLFKPGRKELLVLFSRGFREVYDPLCLARAIPEVIKEVPEARFILAGNGPLREKVAEMLEDAGPGISIPGILPEDELANLMGRARVVVTPALSDSIPLTALEAMASGAVLVASDIKANRQWASTSAPVLLFPPSDADALAKALVRALTEEGLSQQALEQGPPLVDANWRWDEAAATVEALYHELCSSRA